MRTQRGSARCVKVDGSAGSVWKRDFALLWSGSSISLLGSQSATMAAPLIALLVTKSPIFAGWVTFARTMPSLLLPLLAGAVVDRFDRRRTMLVSQGGRLFAAAGLSAVVFVDRNSDGQAVTAFVDEHIAPVILVAALIEGTFAVFYNVAEIAIIPQIVEGDRLSQALARNEARNHMAQLAGRPLGGLLYGLHAALPFFVDAISYAASWMTLRFMSKPDNGRGPRIKKRRVRMRMLRLVWEDKFLRSLLIICTSTNFLFQAIGLLLVVMATGKDLSGWHVGILLAGPSAGGVLGSMIAPVIIRKLLKGRNQAVLVPCVLGWLLSVFAIAVCNDGLGWLLAWGFVGLIGAHINVALATHQAETVPADSLGRVVSLNRFFTQGLVLPLGALAGGWSISSFGTEPTAIGIVILTAIIFGYTLVAQLRPSTRDDHRMLSRQEGTATPAQAAESHHPAGERAMVDA